MIFNRYPAKRWPGFLFRSPKVTIMVKGKGQTRSWPITVPLPAGVKYRKNTNHKKLREQMITYMMITMILTPYIFSSPQRTYTIQLIKRVFR